MASRSFSFAGFKRSFFNVEMHDGTKLVCKYPSKALFTRIMNYATDKNKDQSASEAIDTIDNLVTDILNSNMGGVHVDKQDIADNYDLEEKIGMINLYTQFLGDLTNNPN